MRVLILVVAFAIVAWVARLPAAPRHIVRVDIRPRVVAARVDGVAMRPVDVDVRVLECEGVAVTLVGSSVVRSERPSSPYPMTFTFRELSVGVYDTSVDCVLRGKVVESKAVGQVIVGSTE